MLTVHLLGPIEVHRDGQPLDLGGPMLRATVAHLALEAGRVVSVERLIDRLWGDDPPGAPLGTLQSYVSRLRRALEPERGAGATPQILVSEAPGYVLRVPTEAVDVHRFRTLTAEAREATAAGDHQSSLRSLDAAIALWRGPALAGVGPEDQIRTIVARLEEERDSAVEDRFDALLALGRHQELVPSLQEAVGEQPLRERLWALLALALYRCDRQADALRALSQARSVLLDELGLDPGPALRDLESRILAQDPSLLLAAAPQSVATAPAPIVEHAALPSAELIGRTAEWDTATQAIDAAGAGRAALLLIEGEPGIGKTTLCDALLAHASAAGWRTAVGRSVEPELAPSLWPWIEIVRSIAPAVQGGGTDDPWREYMVGGAEAAGGSLAAVELAERFVALLDRVGPDRHGASRWVLL
ncbi:MAG TPA: BTAD domain-containing putative transcriptional regulator, partial [Ilumatobacteraceae bacterium]